jgi:alpha-tubulin suppressor-like RCC1 family protein
MLFRQGLFVQPKLGSQLYSWGNNTTGSLGINSTTSYSSPVLVSSVTSVSWAKIVLGFNHAVAVRNDGSLWTWGENTLGQLGQGTQTAYSATPLNVTGTTTWSKISAGNSFIVAIQSDGTLWAWGANASGQLGTASLTFTSSPVLVSGPVNTSWSAVACGINHSFAISTTGQLYAWGLNSSGQLGDSTTDNKSSPILIPSPGSLSWAVITGGYSNNSAAITS